MNWELLDRIFNNSSVATLVGVLSGSILVIPTFLKQKRLAKLEKLKENIQILLEKSNIVNLILDRISCSYTLVKDSKLSREEFLEATKKEFSEISLIINDEIPKLTARIENYVSMYLYNKNDANIKLDIFLKEINKWHSNVVGIIFEGYDFEKRISKNEKFNLSNAKEEAKKFINYIGDGSRFNFVKSCIEFFKKFNNVITSLLYFIL